MSFVAKEELMKFHDARKYAFSFRWVYADKDFRDAKHFLLHHDGIFMKVFLSDRKEIEFWVGTIHNFQKSERALKVNWSWYSILLVVADATKGFKIIEKVQEDYKASWLIDHSICF